MLFSFGPPYEETNPYLIQLVDSLPESVRPQYFTWRRAIAGSYDVFHMHWPEIKLRGTTRPRSAVRAVLFLAMLVRIRLQRKALVHTLHNTAPHERPGAPQRALLALCHRWTTLWITLSERTPAPPDVESVVAPIGHYRGWLPDGARPASEPGRLLHFGLVRRYKGVEHLVDAFAGVADPDLRLHVVGKIADDDLAGDIAERARRDPRVRVTAEYVAEERLVDEVCRSELVVLPFTAITNSSSMLLALSLDRPVLVPSAPVIDEIAAEVGPGWVLTYSGALDATTLAESLDRVRSAERTDRPDLARRDWPGIGRTHESAYRRALSMRRDDA